MAYLLLNNNDKIKQDTMLEEENIILNNNQLNMFNPCGDKFNKTYYGILQYASMRYASGTYSNQIDVSKDLQKMINRRKKFLSQHIGNSNTIIYMVKKVNPYVMTYDTLKLLPPKICKFTNLRSLYDGKFITNYNLGINVTNDDPFDINSIYIIWKQIYDLLSVGKIKSNFNLHCKLFPLMPEVTKKCANEYLIHILQNCSTNTKDYCWSVIMKKYESKKLFSTKKSFDDIMDKILKEINLM